MSPNEPETGEKRQLSREQIDIIGEVSNISMGSAATALSNIIGKKVTITSPQVELGTEASLDQLQRIPSIGVTISYTEGIVGRDILVIRKGDAVKIVDVLMGGALPEDEEFGELHISAIAEVMNQMMGSAATALSGFIGRPVNISPPNAFILTDENKAEKLAFLHENIKEIILVRFLFQVENMFESDIYTIMTQEFAEELVQAMLENMGMTDMISETESAPAAAAVPEPTEPEPVLTAVAPPPEPVVEVPRPAPAPAPRREPEPPRVPQARAPAVPTAVRPAILPDFGETERLTDAESANFNLIQEVPLDLAVEVGRAKKLVREVIDFSVGTIIELDKQAGDPVDIIVNGQLIAHGEVVVIDESFGVRVTEIINKKSKGL